MKNPVYNRKKFNTPKSPPIITARRLLDQGRLAASVYRNISCSRTPRNLPVSLLLLLCLRRARTFCRRADVARARAIDQSNDECTGLHNEARTHITQVVQFALLLLLGV